MTMTRFSTYGALIFAACLTGAACAANPETTFESLDTNKDGFIERSDIPADHELTELFANYDIDKDNRLSTDEFDIYLGKDEPEEAEE